MEFGQDESGKKDKLLLVSGVGLLAGGLLLMMRKSEINPAVLAWRNEVNNCKRGMISTARVLAFIHYYSEGMASWQSPDGQHIGLMGFPIYWSFGWRADKPSNYSLQSRLLEDPCLNVRVSTEYLDYLYDVLGVRIDPSRGYTLPDGTYIPPGSQPPPGTVILPPSEYDVYSGDVEFFGLGQVSLYFIDTAPAEIYYNTGKAVQMVNGSYQGIEFVNEIDRLEQLYRKEVGDE